MNTDASKSTSVSIQKLRLQMAIRPALFSHKAVEMAFIEDFLYLLGGEVLQEATAARAMAAASQGRDASERSHCRDCSRTWALHSHQRPSCTMHTLIWGAAALQSCPSPLHSSQPAVVLSHPCMNYTRLRAIVGCPSMDCTIATCYACQVLVG